MQMHCYFKMMPVQNQWTLNCSCARMYIRTYASIHALVRTHKGQISHSNHTLNCHYFTAYDFIQPNVWCEKL